MGYLLPPVKISNIILSQVVEELRWPEKNCHSHPNTLRWPGITCSGTNAEASIPDFYRGDEEWLPADWWYDKVRRSSAVAGAHGEKKL